MTTAIFELVRRHSIQELCTKQKESQILKVHYLNLQTIS